jgi:hypothetical protein
MNDDTDLDNDNFDLILDSVPPGTLNAAQLPSAPPAQAPQPPAAPLSEQPTYTPFQTLAPPPGAVPVFLPQAPVAPPAEMPVFAAPAPAAPAPPPSPPVPKRSRHGVLIGILALLLAVNGVVVAHRYGLITFPDLTSGGNKKSEGPQAKKSEEKSSQQANNSTDAKGGNANPDGGNPGGGNQGGGNAGGANPGGNPNGGNAGGGNPSDGNAGGANAGAGKPKLPEPQPQPQPQPKANPRPFKSTRDMLVAVQGHLLKLPEEDRKFQRYFALAHLSNDKGLSDKQLDQYRAALTALVRHLQPSKEAIRIEPIDQARLVLCLDLRTVGWEKLETWREVLKRYPHLLVYGGARDAEVAELGKEIRELSDSDMPIVQLDWFLYAAGRSPLREKLGPDANPLTPATVAALYQRYLHAVTLEQAARELGLADPQELRSAVQASQLLRAHGLGALLNGGSVSRQEWTSLARTFSPYQEAAEQLGQGTPYRVD